MELRNSRLTHRQTPLVAKLHIRLAHFAAIIIAAVFIAALLLPASSATSSKQPLRTEQPASIASRAATIKQNISSPSAFASRVALPVTMDETIQTFAADCTTPQTSFNLGDTVCAKVVGAPLGTFTVARRFQWSNTEPLVVRQNDITSDTQTDVFTLPSTNTSVVDGQTIDNRGTWSVSVMDTSDGSNRATAFFTVLNPNNKVADVQVSTVARTDATRPAAGADVVFLVYVKNNGPDAATTLTLTDAVPSNTTFVSVSQDAGPTANCNNPASGGTGTSTCTISSLAGGATASFSFTYHVQSGTTDGTQITDTASASSSTAEKDNSNNSSSATIGVVTPTCTITPPADKTQDNDLDAQGHALSGATVTYSDPTTSSTTNPSSCGTVTCTPVSGSFFQIGATNVTCSDGINDPVHFKVTITDTEAPVISCPSDITVPESTHGSGQAVVNFPTPTATDNSGQVTVTTDIASGSTFTTQDSPKTVTATATDAAGHTATCTFKVTVVPSDCSISCPSDIVQAPDSGQNGAIVTYPNAGTTGTTCGTVSYSKASGSFFPLGTTTVTATAAGGETCSFKVTITTDTTPPVISCPTDVSVTVQGNGCSASATLGTPTATDDTTPANQIQIVGTRVDGLALTDPYPVGSNIVTWTATDQAGNPASCTQLVNVTETVAPSVTPPAPVTVNVNSSCDDVEVPNFITGLVASDNCTPRANLEITQSPAAETLVGVGSHPVTITVKDVSGNTTTVSTSFNVVDNTPPTFTFVPPAVTANTGPGATSCSAIVTDAQLGTATATDNCPGVTVTRSPSGNTFPVGPTTVTWTATDASGNTTTASQTVTVNDNTPPVIAQPADVTVYLPLNSTATSTTVNYPAATVTDNCAGPYTVNYSQASGTSFPVGTTVVTVTATDAHSNNATPVTFKVIVLYDFTGFFSPVNNLPTLNVVNAGRAIPVKFSLSGNKGLSIFVVGSPQSGVIPCDASAPATDLTATVTAGGSSLNYDATSDQYIYTWKTDSTWASGSCRQLVVTLSDGSTHVANFKFR
jgi:hypothetical protein